MQAAPLPDRGVLKISGDDARHFLHGLLTTDVAGLSPGAARFAALLTPQGKIIADMLVVDAGDGFLLDLPRALADTLLGRLKIYRLRAKVMLEDRSAALGVVALWDGEPAAAPADAIVFRDPRLPGLGFRALLPAEGVGAAIATVGASLADAASYAAHRIALGVPQGGVDFAYGDAFPHEADMDQLAGVDFKKGCYVGQEVVSRMQHRGTTRSRVVPVTLAATAEAPAAGTPVSAGDTAVGTLGGSAGARALALLRLDRFADALAAGTPLVAGTAVVTPVKPGWATFAWPGETAAAE